MGRAVSTMDSRSAPVTSAAARLVRSLGGWLFEPLPVSRVAALRVLVFAFVIVDVVLLHTSGWYHGYADPVWYEPLVMGKVLHLPAASLRRWSDRCARPTVGSRARATTKSARSWSTLP